MMFKTDVIMTITAIVATLIGFVLMTVIAKHSSKYFVLQQRCLGEINLVTLRKFTQVIQL